MTIPEPWNDNHASFVNKDSQIANLLTNEQKTAFHSIDQDANTFIRSNLSITDGYNTTIPNVFEAINVAYSIVQTMNSEISALKTNVETLSSDIEAMKQQIEQLTPQT